MGADIAWRSTTVYPSSERGIARRDGPDSPGGKRSLAATGARPLFRRDPGGLEPDRRYLDAVHRLDAVAHNIGGLPATRRDPAARHDDLVVGLLADDRAAYLRASVTGKTCWTRRPGHRLFYSVRPSRVARTAMRGSGRKRTRNARAATTRAVEEGCPCLAFAIFSMAYLAHLFRAKGSSRPGHPTTSLHARFMARIQPPPPAGPSRPRARFAPSGTNVAGALAQCGKRR